MRLQDLVDLYRTEQTYMNLFGSVNGYRGEFETRARRVAELICEEQNVTFGETAMQLPLDTEMGEKSAAAFTELNEWRERSR